MPLWLISYALKGLGWLKDAWRWCTANAVHMLITALALCACWGLYERGEHRHWVHVAGVTEKRLEAIRDAAKQADNTSTNIASNTSATHPLTVSRNRALAAPYLDTHRVPATPSASGADHGPAFPAETASIPFMVAVSEPDFGFCNDAISYGTDASDWARKLIAAGLAKPEADKPIEDGQ